MDTKNQLQCIQQTKCELSALQSNPKTQHLIPAKPVDYFQMSNIQLNDDLMFQLWSLMMDFYGKKWTDQFGDFYDADGNVRSTVNTWAQALSRIPPNRLERGILKCTQERTSPFPPTLPEFYQLCGKESWE